MKARSELRENSLNAAPAVQGDALPSPRKSVIRRVLFVMLLLFVLAGTAAITILMTLVLPSMYKAQANERYSNVLQNANVGDVVSIGTYEQDNNRLNGPEPIEWQVIAREEDRCLLISRYALDCVRFNAYDGLATWDYSSVLNWLNQTFYNEAFSQSEKTLLRRTDVSADRNPFFPSDTGGETSEKIFLLSISETYEYFNSDHERSCAPTAYTIAKGVNVSDGKCIWWLRTNGFDASVAARVLPDGRINYCGFHVDSDDNAVRPAMWVAFDAYVTAP